MALHPATDVSDSVAGVPLQSLANTFAPASVWRALGHDLARLHKVQRTAATTRFATNDERYDAAPWLDDCLAAGTLLADEADWLHNRLDRLRPNVDPSAAPRLYHGDVNAGNLLVSRQGDTYHALLDWGSTMWFDAAYDFAVVTLAAVPWMLEGYRAQASLPRAATLEARILWYHITLAIWSTRHRSARDRAAIAEHMARLRRQTEAFVTHAARR